MSQESDIIKRKNIKWPNIIDIVEKELIKYKQQDIAISLRTMFYNLVSDNHLPNTDNYYESLSRYTARARMNRRLPIDCFTDSSRNMVAGFPEQYKTLSDFIERGYLEELKKLPEEYPKLIPKWYRQPEYIEVWIEKDAMLSTFKSVLKGRDVRIVSNKGFDSLSWLYKNIRRLNSWQLQYVDPMSLDTDDANYLRKKIHVLYFGDFDPSGDGMDDDLMNRITLLRENKHTSISLKDIDFQRIGVTKQQVIEWKLSTSIDDATQEKLDDDPRTSGFIAKYGKLYAVELDALPKFPDKFKELVLSSVDKYYDKKIHEENLEEYNKQYPGDDAKNLIKQSLERFLKEF